MNKVGRTGSRDSTVSDTNRKGCSKEVAVVRDER